MEPWQEEALLHLGRRPKPMCQCCGREILTECYLDLAPFGLSGMACESCVSHHTHYL